MITSACFQVFCFVTGRIVTGTWWYFTMLVIAAYTANLTAFLTQELAGDISNLENLLEQVSHMRLYNRAVNPTTTYEMK